MAEELSAPLTAPPAGDAGDEETAARALALRYRLEYVDVGSFAPDPEILKSVPVELMFRYNFLPYRREGTRLVLVMADPTDIPVVDELSLLLQTPIQPAVGTPRAIQEALKRGQGTTRVLEEASESFRSRSCGETTTATRSSRSTRSRPTRLPSSGSWTPPSSTR